jgi:protoheme IX farnesyltransferase
MLPAVASLETTATRILGYTVVLWALTLLFAPVAGMGSLYVAAAVALGAVFTAFAVRLRRQPTAAVAMRLFSWSITYVTLLFAAMAIDPLL